MSINILIFIMRFHCLFVHIDDMEEHQRVRLCVCLEQNNADMRYTATQRDMSILRNCDTAVLAIDMRRCRCRWRFLIRAALRCWRWMMLIDGKAASASESEFKIWNSSIMALFGPLLWYLLLNFPPLPSYKSSNCQCIVVGIAYQCPSFHQEA